MIVSDWLQLSGLILIILGAIWRVNTAHNKRLEAIEDKITQLQNDYHTLQISMGKVEGMFWEWLRQGTFFVKPPSKTPNNQ